MELNASPPLDQAICSPFNIRKIKFGDTYARNFHLRKGEHMCKSKGLHVVPKIYKEEI